LIPKSKDHVNVFLCEFLILHSKGLIHSGCQNKTEVTIAVP